MRRSRGSAEQDHAIEASFEHGRSGEGTPAAVLSSQAKMCIKGDPNGLRLAKKIRMHC